MDSILKNGLPYHRLLSFFEASKNSRSNVVAAFYMDSPAGIFMGYVLTIVYVDTKIKTQ
jgi:hypothetical protein